jgi:hypothetical protein
MMLLGLYRLKSKEKIASSSGNEHDEEDSNEPDYGNEDKDQLEEEQEQNSGEITVNQVF